MCEVVGAFLGCEGAEEVSDGAPQRLDGSCGGLSQQGFELGEELVNMVEVRGIGGQEDEVCAARRDCLPHISCRMDSGTRSRWAIAGRSRMTGLLELSNVTAGVIMAGLLIRLRWRSRRRA